jgi:hypothetical protein
VASFVGASIEDEVKDTAVDKVEESIVKKSDKMHQLVKWNKELLTSSLVVAAESMPRSRPTV